MDNFDLFTQIKISQETPVQVNVQECQHTNIITTNGNHICIDCGHQCEQGLAYDKEWRYYGSSDTKFTSDPNRCQMRKVVDKNIFRDVEKLGFSNKIIDNANKLYQNITGGQIFRGNTRRSIVFACIFHSYKMENNPQTCESLMKTFGITKKNALKGLKYVNLNADKNSTIRTTYISVETIINEIMSRFNATEQDKQSVLNIYTQIKNKSSLINRSRPQSVAAGIVRYYSIQKNKKISMNDFKNIVDLSELTINRISKEITRLLSI